MTQQVIVTRIDDITGDEGAETCVFSIDNTEYEIDLITKNASKFRKVLSPYIAAARIMKAPRTSKAPKYSASQRSSNAEIRQWAKHHEIPINERGRIPDEVRAKFERARFGVVSDPPAPKPDPSGSAPADSAEPPTELPALSELRESLERKPRTRKPRSTRPSKDGK